MTLERDEQAAAIQSREDFVAFVQALVRDLEHPAGGEGWENLNLARYLEAVAAWAGDVDIERFYQHLGKPAPREPGWNFIGQMLYAAKMYE